jgi:uncharacterized protein (TIGR02147 family)
MKKIKFNYIDILKQQLEIRTAKNSNYSLRAFARDLDLNPSRLSEILGQKKGLSMAAAEALAERLGLSKDEREFFLLSVTAQHSRSLKNKTEAENTLNKKLTPEKKIKQLEQLDIEQAYNWYHTAILELTELKDCQHSVEWFAKKLKLKKVIIKNALERLEKIGWIKCDDGIYKSTYTESETTFDVPSSTIRKYHEEVLKKAEHSLMTDDLKEREFLNMTLAFSQDQMTEAKEAIRLFQKDFADKFYPKEKDKDSVYQLSVHLFRLDSNLEAKEL